MSPTKPDPETRTAERREAATTAKADREPTPDEERRAEQHDLDESVVAHEEEMLERGANQEGEGRLP